MFVSLQHIEERAEKFELPFWKAIQLDDCIEQDITEEESFKKMRAMYQAMKDSDLNYEPELTSASGLVGGEGYKILKARQNNNLLCGSFIGLVMEKALKIAASNACMKRIVAAPTAGSCGVVPAVLLSYQETFNIDDDKMVEALYVVAGIGSVIAHRATLAGALGGCQAEIGSASAMAAGALTYLRGGTNKQITHSAALALKGLLGLACDPVAGLVEVPCVKRNVIGSSNAVTSSDLALNEVYSKIPPDEVIDAMKNVGRCMSNDIKETARGGLAITPTGLKYKEKMKMD